MHPLKGWAVTVPVLLIVAVAERAVEMGSVCFRVTMVLFWHAVMDQRDVLDTVTGCVSVDLG